MSDSWVVLGDPKHGISWGPFTKAEALAFEAEYPETRMAVSLAGACSQIETCVTYGFDYKPLPKGEA